MASAGSSRSSSSTVQEYVYFLSDNLGMLHFGCRQTHSIAQPKEAMEGFIFGDFQNTLSSMFASKGGGEEGAEVDSSDDDDVMIGVDVTRAHNGFLYSVADSVPLKKERTNGCTLLQLSVKARKKKINKLRSPESGSPNPGSPRSRIGSPRSRIGSPRSIFKLSPKMGSHIVKRCGISSPKGQDPTVDLTGYTARKINVELKRGEQSKYPDPAKHLGGLAGQLPVSVLATAHLFDKVRRFISLSSFGN